MPTVHLRLETSIAEAERIAAILETTLDGEASIATFELAPGLWSIELYLTADGADPVAAAEARFRDVVGGDGFGLAVEARVLLDTDWVARSIEGLDPVRAGRFLVHGSHDRIRAAAMGGIAIEIDAGQAFGTGHHGTTAGCLTAIERLLRRRSFDAVLDIGTGSGVLAIAVAKATRQRVLASDIDPVAAAVAAANARRNGVHHLVKPVVAAGLHHRAIARRRYDLVIANILAGPLVALAGKIVQVMAPDGALVLSGLLHDQEARVLGAYRARGLPLQDRIRLDGWSTLILGRR